MSSRAIVGRAADLALEATVVGSFSRLGIEARRRVEPWPDPPRVEGQVVLVTGATSGLGLAAATSLARLGASVRICGRDGHRAERARAAIVTASGNSDVEYLLADLGDLDAARRLADEVAARFGRLDGLVHNAGALLRSRQLSPQAIESTVATHLLSPFVLTERLLPLLRSTPGARVVTVTSGGMYTQRFDLATLELPADSYDGVVAYARAKRAQVVLTREWQLRYGRAGLRFHTVHPGWADTPGVRASLPGFARVMGPLLRTPEEGADTIVWLAAGAPGTEEGGHLWHDRRARGEYHVPWTRPRHTDRLAEGPALWAWCSERTGEGAAVQR